MDRKIFLYYFYYAKYVSRENNSCNRREIFPVGRKIFSQYLSKFRLVPTTASKTSWRNHDPSRIHRGAIFEAISRRDRRGLNPSAVVIRAVGTIFLQRRRGRKGRGRRDSVEIHVGK